MTDDFHLPPTTDKEVCRRICFVGLIRFEPFSLVLLSFITIRTSWRWMLLYGWFDPKVLRHFRCKQTVSNAYPIKIIHAFLISHLLNRIKSLHNTRNERLNIISCTKSDEEPIFVENICHLSLNGSESFMEASFMSDRWLVADPFHLPSVTLCVSVSAMPSSNLKRELLPFFYVD